MNLFWGLVVGVISYFVAHLVFNEFISGLLALLVGVIVAFGYSKYYGPRG